MSRLGHPLPSRSQYQGTKDPHLGNSRGRHRKWRRRIRFHVGISTGCEIINRSTGHVIYYPSTSIPSFEVTLLRSQTYGYVSEEAMGEREVSHLQHSFSKENHFFPGLFDDKILDLVPIIVRSTSSEVYFVNCVLFIACRSSCRFMSDIGDEIVYSRRMVRRGVQV